MSHFLRSTRFRAALLLILLTLIGGVIRFTALDKPTIWYDEAATFGRVAGSYRQMLSALEDAGFGPLHYTAYWWIKNGLPYWGHIAPSRGLQLEVFGRRDREPGGREFDDPAAPKDWTPAKQIFANGITLTPFYMRLIPALSGTLMIPAMYWLTRELLSRRRIALLVATLTAFSAYLLNYSRDAKMYSDLWLMVALNVAALLWFLRARRFIAWLTWVVTGTAMVGLQLQGLGVIGIELLIVLTARRQYLTSLFLIISTPIMIIVSGAISFASAFLRLFRSTLDRSDRPEPAPSPDRWTEAVARYKDWRNWVDILSLALVAGVAAHEVCERFHWQNFSWQNFVLLLAVSCVFERSLPLRGMPIRIASSWYFAAIISLQVSFIVVLIVAKNNWPVIPILGTAILVVHLIRAIRVSLSLPQKVARSDAAIPLAADTPQSDLYRRWFLNLHMPPLLAYLLGLACIGIGPAIYFTSFNQFTDRISEQGWNASGLQWVPEYNFGRSGPELAEYTFSAFLTGWEWPRQDVYRVKLKDGRELQAKLRELGTGGVEITPVVGERYGFGRRGPRGRRDDDHSVVAINELPDDAIFTVPADQISSKDRIVDEIEQIDVRTFRLHVGGTIALAILLALGAFPWRWPWKRDAALHFQPMRFHAVFWLAAWIALPMYGLYLFSMSNNVAPSDWFHRAIETWREHAWVKVAAPTVALLAFLVCDLTWKRRLLRVSQFLLAAGIVVGLCWIARVGYVYKSTHADENWTSHGSAWIPRYVGICLPAVLIVAASLIARLPTKLLRGVAIGVFIAVNAGQFIERVEASEPPIDRMVADALHAKQESATEQFFYGIPRGAMGPPGTAALFTAPSRYYYLTSLPNKQINPQFVRFPMSSLDHDLLGRDTIITRAEQVAAEVSRAPKTVNRIVVWDRLQPGKIDLTDHIADALGSEWSRESEDFFTARDHWTWRDLWQYRRRVYVRSRTPTTAPIEISG